MNGEFYDAALKAVCIQRGDVFWPPDSQLPMTEPEDALIPQIGFIGADYRRGGTLLLGINPGGGGDTYSRTAEDAILLPMIDALRRSKASLEAMWTMFDQVLANMQTWNLWRIVEPVLGASGNTPSAIAYLNCCPFRTLRDGRPHAHALRQCRDIHLGPLIRELTPNRIIALGKKAGDVLAKELRFDASRYVVRRTRGDSYIHPDAAKVLAEIRRDRSDSSYSGPGRRSSDSMTLAST